MQQKWTAGALGLLLMAGTVALPSAALARRRGNFLERHPVMTGVGAAAVAHHMGKKRRAHGRRGNFAERHPVLTGVAAGAVAHHMAKKHH